MRISDWSSDVCSSDLFAARGEGESPGEGEGAGAPNDRGAGPACAPRGERRSACQAKISAVRRGNASRTRRSSGRGNRRYAGSRACRGPRADRSEEHTSELQYLMRISYAVFVLKKKTIHRK